MIENLTIITGNPHKAEQFAKYVGIDVQHAKLDLNEIQSLKLVEIIEHKVRQAYSIIQQPVIVDDVAFEASALNGLPGPFIKFFEQALGVARFAELVHKFEDKSATVRVMLGFFDGKKFESFEGITAGTVAPIPQGSGGFGFDQIYIPEGFTQTRGEMNEADYDKTNHRKLATLKLKKFLESYQIDSGASPE